MNIKNPVFKKELFESVFKSEIGWTLKIKKTDYDGYYGEVYQGEKLIQVIAQDLGIEDVERKLTDVWERIVEIEHNRVSQYIYE